MWPVLKEMLDLLLFNWRRPFVQVEVDPWQLGALILSIPLAWNCHALVALEYPIWRHIVLERLNGIYNVCIRPVEVERVDDDPTSDLGGLAKFRAYVSLTKAYLDSLRAKPAEPSYPQCTTD